MNKLPPFERQSLAQHKQQRFWQIIFPILLFSFLILTAGGFTVFAGADRDRLWADISIIWLVIPVLTISFFLLILLAGSIYGLSRLINLIPDYSRRLQNFFTRIETGTRKVVDSSMKPFFWISRMKNSVTRFLNSIKI